MVSDIMQESILTNVSNTEQSIPVSTDGQKKRSTTKEKKEKVVLEKNFVMRCTTVYQNKLDKVKGGII